MTKKSASKPRSLSPQVMRRAEKHLGRADKTMARLVAEHGPCPLADREFRPFETLASSIMRQLLSRKAADTIEGRVLGLLPSFTPAGFLGVSAEDLRGAGLSWAKARHLLELSARTNDGRLDFEDLQHRPDEDVVKALVELPGVGRWTAEMFLLFGLKRPDVLALGDAGLQRSSKLLYGDESKLEEVGEAWRPYRSVASWYLWRNLAPEKINT